MKFSITTQELNYIVGKCLNVVSSKLTIPILMNLLIEAQNGLLTVTATDLTVSIKCFTEVNVIEEGSTTLPAKKFSQLLHELTAMNVEVKTGSNNITEVTADDSRFRLLGMDKATYPALPDLQGATRITVKQADFKDALQRTAFAVSREDPRFALTGVYMQINNGKATFTATDGKRLARTYFPIDIDPAYVGKFILPPKAADEILKCLTNEDDAQIYLMDDKIAVETNDAILITKLLTGEYPDVSKIIPTTSKYVIQLHRDELSILLRQVALFSNEVEQQHVAKFTFNEGELKLSANSMTIGEGKVSMPVNFHDHKFEIAFNPDYLLDVLRHSKADVVSLGITDPHCPGLIADQDLATNPVNDVSPLFLLMPMRLNEG